MSATVAVIVSIASAAVAIGSFLVNARSTVRKDCRDDTTEALKMKDERIDELEQKVNRMQSDIDALAAKVRLLERRIDQYGCWNAPHCDNRKPLSGPNPHGDT